MRPRGGDADKRELPAVRSPLRVDLRAGGRRDRSRKGAIRVRDPDVEASQNTAREGDLVACRRPVGLSTAGEREPLLGVAVDADRVDLGVPVAGARERQPPARRRPRRVKRLRRVLCHLPDVGLALVGHEDLPPPVDAAREGEAAAARRPDRGAGILDRECDRPGGLRSGGRLARADRCEPHGLPDRVLVGQRPVRLSRRRRRRCGRGPGGRLARRLSCPQADRRDDQQRR